MLQYLLLFFSIFSNYKYDNFFQNFSHKINHKIAVAIFCFNRPHYFDVALRSIENNPESNYLPFFFFLDGGPNSKQNEYVKIIENSNIKHKYIITRLENYGIGKNIIDARRFLFEFCNFETLILTEEDIQVNDTFFEFLLKLHSWAHNNYKNIGTVQCWNQECLLTDKQKLASLQLLKPVNPWWSGVCYTQTKKVWSDIAPILYYYEKNFIDTLEKNSRFKSKPARGPYAGQIKNWLKSLAQHRVNNNENSTFLKFDNKKIINHIKSSKNSAGNQDCVNAIALWLKGYERLQTVVNHLIHIGEDGCSWKSNQYKKLSMYLQTLSNYDVSKITDFKIVANI